MCNCSDIDDLIIFYKDGKYKIIRVAEKIFVGKNVMHVAVFKKNDKRTTYNVVYRDGKQGFYFIKRFNVTGITRDKEYDLTQGTAGSRVLYFTANPNGEAEIIKITLDPNPKLKKIFMEKDFSEVLIKGRASKGNLLTKNTVHRIGLKSHGHSTLGGRKVWFDPDVNRLNYDEHGRLLGEFNEDDSILVVLKNGDFYLTNFDVNNHYEDNIDRIEKYDATKVWSAVLFDADQQGYPYLKRFLMEGSKRKLNYLGENANSRLVLLTDTPYPRIRVSFGGNDAFRDPMEIDVEQFIAVKGFKAKGKRITTWQIESIEELEPLRQPEPEADDDGNDDGNQEEDGEQESGNGETATAETATTESLEKAETTETTETAETTAAESTEPVTAETIEPAAVGKEDAASAETEVPAPAKKKKAAPAPQKKTEAPVTEETASNETATSPKQAKPKPRKKSSASDSHQSQLDKSGQLSLFGDDF